MRDDYAGKPTPRIVWRREDGQKIIVPRTSSSSKASQQTTSAGTGKVGIMSSNSAVNDVAEHQHQLSTKPTTPKALEWAASTGDYSAPGPSSLQYTSRERSKGMYRSYIIKLNAIELKTVVCTEVEAYHGEVLRLYRVTRAMMGAYMCVANNGVPPAVSKRVPLNVNCKYIQLYRERRVRMSL